MSQEKDKDWWGGFASPLARVELQLDPPADGDDPMLDLSAAVRVGRSLFLGSDEGSTLERLRWDGERWAHGDRLDLGRALDLHHGGEADIEGLAEDAGWLWVLGSHGRTRPKLEGPDKDRIDLAAFSALRDTRPRCLLARLPLVPNADGAMRAVRRDGERRAGLLRQTKSGNALARRFKADPLLAPFARVPAKEGGIDLEGIAVAGARVAIGMRGPVPQGYGLLLEFEVDSPPSGRLKIAGPVYKRLLDLDGLGIRDLKRIGDDLLVLAGPSTAVHGPFALYRWRKWLHEPPLHAELVRLHRPERLLDLPFGRGEDYPEGLAVLDPGDHGLGREETPLLVVVDRPARRRLDQARRRIACDLFVLPR